MRDNLRPIVIHSAMGVEIKFLLDKIGDVKKINYGDFIFYEGNYKGYPIVLNISGVGTINTASDMMYIIDKYNPLCVINIGIVGSYRKEIHKNDLVICNRCLNVNSYRTSYLEEGNGSDYSRWEMITFKEGIDELVYWDADEQLLNIMYKIKDKYSYGKCVNGIIGSGDVWNDEVDRLLFLRDKYKLCCSDMESISVYMVCNKFKVPCISLKIVSDNIILGEDYDRNVSKNIEDILLIYVNEIIDSKYCV